MSSDSCFYVKGWSAMPPGLENTECYKTVVATGGSQSWLKAACQVCRAEPALEWCLLGYIGCGSSAEEHWGGQARKLDGRCYVAP